MPLYKKLQYNGGRFLHGHSWLGVVFVFYMYFYLISVSVYIHICICKVYVKYFCLYMSQLMYKVS